MSDIFVNKLHKRVLQARAMGVSIRDSEIYLLTSRLLEDDSILTFPDGKHLFSALDVISLGAISFLYGTVRESRDVVLEMDSSGFGALHYAAMYHFDDPFWDASRLARDFDETSLKEICLSSDNDQRHSVVSLLLEQDRCDILDGLMVKCLGIDPFHSEFQDIYFNWLHEALFCNAKGTVIYLFNQHKDGLQASLKRSPSADPPEMISPADLIFLCHTMEKDHQCNCSLYVDQILSPLEYGLKSILYSYEQLAILGYTGKLKGLSSAYESEDLLARIFRDTALCKV